MMHTDPVWLRDEFPQSPELCYLNHAAVSPWPASTGRAVQDFARENVLTGAVRYPHWMAVEKRLRHRLARLIGASGTECIALLKSTSEALSTVAFGLNWSAGDQVIISDQEFPSNRVVWKALEQRFGVIVVEVDLALADSPEDALLAALTDRTRLLSISSVQYGSGLRLDLHRLGCALKSADVLFCVDAIQSAGACPIDVEADSIDFLMADGHKWMMGPEGLALFYCRANQLERLQLNQYGWHMLAARGRYDDPDTRPAEDATRFECGSPNMTGIMALDASLAVLERYGLAEVERAVMNRVAWLAGALRILPGVELLTTSASQLDTEPSIPSTDALGPVAAASSRRDPALVRGQARARSLGILVIRPGTHDPAELARRLLQQGVVCAARGGGLRLSPHFYTPDKVLEQAVGHIASLLQ